MYLEILRNYNCPVNILKEDTRIRFSVWALSLLLFSYAQQTDHLNFFTLFIQSLFLGPSNSLDVPIDFCASLFPCFLLSFIICNMSFAIQAFLFLPVLVPISCLSMLFSILCISFHYSCTYFGSFKRQPLLLVDCFCIYDLLE